MSKTAIYSVLSAEEEIDFESSSQIKLILDGVNWEQALNSAKKLIRPVKFKAARRTNVTVLGCCLDIVVLVTIGKLVGLGIPTKRKTTPLITTEATSVTKKSKKKEDAPSHFRFKINSLQIDFIPPIVAEEQLS